MKVVDDSLNKYGLGIDTGGTYTDAVIYDLDGRDVIACAKSETTHEELSRGMIDTLKKLPADMFSRLSVVSISTTLATNACVEGNGGNAALIIIGGDLKIVANDGANYGLPDAKDIIFADAEICADGHIVREPDWNDMLSAAKMHADAETFAVVSQWGMRNPALEIKARGLITAALERQVVCGHELSGELNYLKRASSALLNARLIPVITGFIKAIRVSLFDMGITAPVVIVRSDGSLMSESFTLTRPVETLLCGPAASVAGGIVLTGQRDCLIVDMGGTTTDVAVIKNGRAKFAPDGASVGNWRTNVRSIYMDTFGLGGDSYIRPAKDGGVDIGPARALPMCRLASAYPRALNKLSELLDCGDSHAVPLNEFILLSKKPLPEHRLSRDEEAICRALENGPLMVRELAAATGLPLIRPAYARLIKLGIAMKSALTPTDIMHVSGEYVQWDARASRLALEFTARRMNRSPEQLAKEITDDIKSRVFTNLVRILSEDAGIAPPNTETCRAAYEGARLESAFYMPRFSTGAVLVGIGAPTHAFLPDVAKAFGTDCRIPKYAPVANAIGAVVGNVIAEAVASVRPRYIAGELAYTVYSQAGEPGSFKELGDALQYAEKTAARLAKDEAKSRGAQGELSISSESETIAPTIGTATGNEDAYHLETIVRVTAIGAAVI